MAAIAASKSSTAIVKHKCAQVFGRAVHIVVYAPLLSQGGRDEFATFLMELLALGVMSSFGNPPTTNIDTDSNDGRKTKRLFSDYDVLSFVTFSYCSMVNGNSRVIVLSVARL